MRAQCDERDKNIGHRIMRGILLAFENIIGQKQVKMILQEAQAKERLSHAYAFCGAEGMGKRTMAKDFAKLLLCTNKQIHVINEEPHFTECRECNSCKTFESGTNPDFQFVETDEDNLKIESIRKLQEDISMGPMYGDKKLYIICDAHKMTPQAQNCLLKTLEEPPYYAVVILTVSLFENLLETIRSRVFKIDFCKNTVGEVKEAILNNIGPLSAYDFMATYADGNIGKALKFLQNSDFMKEREVALEHLMNLGDENHKKNLDLSGFLEMNKENIQEILDMYALFFRDVLVIKTGAHENILINSDKKDIIKRNFSNFSRSRVIFCIELIEKVRIGLSQNANFSLSMEYLAIGLQEESK